jgi:uncharacterized protein YndB with AHSA1/START domain
MALAEFGNHLDIDASTSRVWSVLSDFEHYRDWNPWIREAAGRMSPGSRLDLVLSTPDADPEDLSVVIEKVAPVASIAVDYDWPCSPGRRTRHEWRLEPIRTGTRLHHTHAVIEAGDGSRSEPFDDRTALGIEMMNTALKARSER